MKDTIIQYLGTIGDILLVLAYIPQIHKLLKTKKSDGISIPSWLTILLGDLCILTYTILRNDTIIAVLFTVFVMENIIIIYLTLRFGKKESVTPIESPISSAKTNLPKKDEENLNKT